MNETTTAPVLGTPTVNADVRSIEVPRRRAVLRQRARPFPVGTASALARRGECHFSSYASVTGDLSSSMHRGPGNTQTAQLGMRFHPDNREAALRPFLDVRAGYGRTPDQYSDLGGIGLGAASTVTLAQRYRHGFGAAIGGGAEYSLTNSLALSTNVSAMRSRMSMYDYTGYSVPTTGSYSMTTSRLALGLRYSPVFRRSDDRH